MTIKIEEPKEQKVVYGKLLDQALVVFLVGYGLSWLAGVVSLWGKK